MLPFGVNLKSLGLALVLLPLLMMAAAVSAAPAAKDAAGYQIQPGDVLSISVWKEPDLQREVLVRPDGSFSFPLAGEVDARGKSVSEVNAIVKERLAKYIAEAVVTVSVQEIRGNKVYVIGQVNKPGEFVVNPSVDVMQALSMAGGLTAFASAGNIIILRRTPEGKKTLQFHYDDVVRGRKLEQNIDLASGDVVVVP
jgi:polysaccharide export outer membrane protein